MPGNTYPCRHKILSRDRRVCITQGMTRPGRRKGVSHHGEVCIMRAVIALLCTVTICGAGGSAPAGGTFAEAAAAAQTTEGTIAVVGPGGLTLTTAAGARVEVKTTAETFMLDRLPARLEEIRVAT